MDDNMEEDDMEIAAAMGFSSFGGNKKRKHDQTNSPKSKPDASGANSTELGVRTKKTTDDESLETLPEYTTTQKKAGPHPTTTSQPTGGTGLAGFLARGHSLSENPPVHHKHNVTEGQRSNTDGDNAEQNISFGGPMISRAELSALRFGVKNEAGDIAYFKPSFLEDPWNNFHSRLKHI